MKRLFLPHPRASARLRRAISALALAAAVGCGSDDNAAPELDESTTDEVGSVALTLTAGYSEVIEFGYLISRGSFTKLGDIDVSNSETASTVVGAIPFGTGYQVTLQGESTSGPLVVCQGSATFDVTSAEISAVSVPVLCKEQASGAPTAVPVPAAANAALCLALLGLGTAFLGRRRSTRAS